MVHTLSAYMRILQRHNTGLCHNAKVCEPKLWVRRDFGGVCAGSDVMTFILYRELKNITVSQHFVIIET